MSPIALDRRRWLLGAAALPLAGCVATPYGPYHRPSSTDPSARSVRAWCGGTAGPVTRLELDAGSGVRITARAERDHAERNRPDLPLRIAIELPRDRPVQLNPAALEVRSGRNGILAIAATTRVHGGARLGATDEVDVEPLRPGGRHGLAADSLAPRGWAVLELLGMEGDTPMALELSGPAVNGDGRRWSFPTVELRRPPSRDTIGWYRSATQRQALADRAAACRRDTPKLACDNLERYSQASFEVDDGEIAWRGEIGALQVPATAQRLRAEIFLAVRRASRWRLDGAAFPMRDLDTGRRQTLRAVRLDLRFAETLPAGAVLELPPAAAASSAIVNLEVPLPSGIGDFEVRIPPVDVGGRRVDVAPLRFERQSFDGGIEPFNC